MAKILIVDDRPVNREFLAALLGYAGHTVLEAADGAEALAIARADSPDLIISDILMPTMDGIELVKRLDADPRLGHVPVIFYTATYRVEEARALAASCGVTTVVPKPSEPQALLDAVHGELGLPVAAVHAAAPLAIRPERVAAATDRLCRTSVDELATLQQQLRATLAADDSPSGKARRLTQITTHLEASLARAQALSMRLAAIVELGFDLAGHGDPEGLLRLFCRAACDIMNAGYAAVCTLREDGGLGELVTSGLTAEQSAELRATLVPTAGVLGDVLQNGAPVRLEGFAGAPEELGLPAAHPRVETFLAAPVKSPTRTYGWFYAAERLGGSPFQDDDEQLALTLVSLLAREYENLVLIDRIRRHTGLLEVEADERKQALEDLRQSEQRFRDLAENIREVFYLLDATTGAFLYVSPAYEEIWDRSRASLYAQPDSWRDAIHPEDRERVAQLADPSAPGASAPSASFEFRILRPDGMRWIKSRNFPIVDADGTLLRIAGVSEDITEAKLQDLKILRLSRIHSVLSRINSAIVRIHERGALLDEACRVAVEHGGFPIVWIGLAQRGSGEVELVSYSGANRAQADLFARAIGEDSMARRGPAAEAMRSGRHVVYDDVGSGPHASLVLRLTAESDYPSVIGLPLVTGEAVSGAIVLFSPERGFFDEQEITLLDELAGDVAFALQYIEKEEQLHHLAYYDPVTGLPNTALFHERVSQAIALEPDAKTALFLLDLDRFTHLNDTLGRHFGDVLLAGVGKRLKSVLPEPGHLARIASDTFALAVSKLKQETEAGLFLQEKILGALSRPFRTDGQEIRISARAGVAVYPVDGRDTGTLFSNAEAALKQAKASGTRYVFYAPALNSRVAEDLALEQKLLSAVERQEFELYYQPKVDAKTNGLTGLEALLRWNSPDEGLVAPGRFISALEDSELILEVGQWVIERALEEHGRWRDKGLTPPRIAVNVSAIQLRYSDFADMVLAACARHGAPREALELEITESVIMADIERNIEQLQKICAAGVTIAVDDFGTGHSSLRYLATLPVHALKIDRSFVTGMTTDAASMTLVSTIIGLAHSFDLDVIAEGVESEEQAKLLRLLKCDAMQGYLFSRPLAVGAAETVLLEGIPAGGAPAAGRHRAGGVVDSEK